MSKPNWSKLVKQNAMLLTVIPLLIGIHWGWWKMQQNPNLVDPRERRALPIFTMYEDLKAKFVGDSIAEEISSSEDKEMIKD